LQTHAAFHHCCSEQLSHCFAVNMLMLCIPIMPKMTLHNGVGLAQY